MTTVVSRKALMNGMASLKMRALPIVLAMRDFTVLGLV
jgi:hypothetical protein